MNILWIIVIGFAAGLIARWLAPGPNNPSGFIVTTLIGIAGAFLATFVGQAIGWYRLDQGAGLIGATVGAVVVLSSGIGWYPAAPLAIPAAMPVSDPGDGCEAAPRSQLRTHLLLSGY